MARVIHSIFRDKESGQLSVIGGPGLKRVVISGDIQIHNKDALQVLIDKLNQLKQETSFPARPF